MTLPPVLEKSCFWIRAKVSRIIVTCLAEQLAGLPKLVVKKRAPNMFKLGSSRRWICMHRVGAELFDVDVHFLLIDEESAGGRVELEESPRQRRLLGEMGRQSDLLRLVWQS